MHSTDNPEILGVLENVILKDSMFCALVSISFWSTYWGVSTKMCYFYCVHKTVFSRCLVGYVKSSKCLLHVIFFCLCPPVLPFSVLSLLGYRTKFCLPFSSHWLRVQEQCYPSVPVIDRHTDTHTYVCMCTYTHTWYVFLYVIHWILLKTINENLNAYCLNASEFSDEPQIVWSRRMFISSHQARIS